MSLLQNPEAQPDQYLGFVVTPDPPDDYQVSSRVAQFRVKFLKQSAQMEKNSFYWKNENFLHEQRSKRLDLDVTLNTLDDIKITHIEVLRRCSVSTKGTQTD
jgi:hypothetical protein